MAAIPMYHTVTSDKKIAMQRVKHILNSPARWTRKEAGRDSRGVPEAPANPAACRFCILGAMDRALINYRINNQLQPIFSSEIEKISEHSSIADFNDDPTIKFADVKKLLNAVYRRVSKPNKK